MFDYRLQISDIINLTSSISLPELALLVPAYGMTDSRRSLFEVGRENSAAKQAEQGKQAKLPHHDLRSSGKKNTRAKLDKLEELEVLK